MKKFIQKLQNSTFFKNTLKISSGALFGQIITLLTFPVVTRIYGDSIIGEWTFLTTVSYIVNSFSDIGLINAMMMEKDDENMQQTYKVITSCVFFISLLAAMIFYIYINFISPSFISLNPLFTAIYLFFSIFTLQQIQTCYTWLNRKSKYKVLMKNPIINNITYSTLAIILGLLGIKQYGYFISWILGQIITLLVMKSHLPKCFFSFKLNEYKKVFKRNKKFITYQLPTGILTELKNNIPNLLIKPLFGVNVLGQYSASTRLIAMPVNLIGTSIGKVLFQTSSDMVRSNKSIGKFTYKSAIISMKLAIIPVIIILALGDVLFKLYLGPDWDIAGNIVRILSIQAFFLFLSICLQGIPISINKQKYAMLFCAAQIFVIISSLTISTYLFNNIYIGLIIFVASFSLINILYFSLLFKAMNILPYKYIFRSLFYILIIFICYLIIRIPMIMFGLVNRL